MLKLELQGEYDLLLNGTMCEETYMLHVLHMRYTNVRQYISIANQCQKKRLHKKTKKNTKKPVIKKRIKQYVRQTVNQ